MLRLCWALARLFLALWRWLRGLPWRAALALGAAGPGQPARPHRLWHTLAVALPAALFAALAIPKLNIVMTPSIDAWIVVPAPGRIARGDYVRFMLLHPIAGPRPVSVTKQALCLPGDRLTMIETPSTAGRGARDGRYFCNGALLGVSLPFGMHGQRLEHLRWRGVVPDGMAYVGSRHPRGFDSRYFGLVPIARLTRMAKLL